LRILLNMVNTPSPTITSVGNDLFGVVRFGIARVAVAFLAFSSVAGAQTAAAKIKAGDAALLARKAPAALANYEAAAAAEPKNVHALWRAAHAAVITGEFDANDRDSLYQLAESYARRAVNVDSNNAMTRFVLAEALGRVALTIESPIQKLPYSRGVYTNATACLKLNPKSAECAHILGVWNAEVMRIDATQRSMAVRFMGATELGEASLAKAEKYLLQAVKTEPNRTVHRLDLGRVYVDMNAPAKARTELNAAVKAPVVDYNDPQYKEHAKKILADLAQH
jgi:tetratricopeptide (TPR) repeat protein